MSETKEGRLVNLHELDSLNQAGVKQRLLEIDASEEKEKLQKLAELLYDIVESMILNQEQSWFTNGEKDKETARSILLSLKKNNKEGEINYEQYVKALFALGSLIPRIDQEGRLTFGGYNVLSVIIKAIKDSSKSEQFKYIHVLTLIGSSCTVKIPKVGELSPMSYEVLRNFEMKRIQSRLNAFEVDIYDEESGAWGKLPEHIREKNT